ncbi:isoprenylcysteine carboxylmethyltransferase family protein [Singulisphaera sp. Ch08]|uniref:Isoprenylcysteine carboxylmethyltransferase family protein n=1 Tax=Singulisphaera sp. Ch08 TaxID=3120278 RepID=A0AAU7C6Y4_9BACT
MQHALYLSTILWILFLVYWLTPRRKRDVGKFCEPLRSRVLHLSLFWTSLIISLAVPFGALGWRWPPASPINGLVGLVIQLVSIGFAIWSRHCLGPYWSGKLAKMMDHKLIEAGPYRKVRHPIYTGILGMFLGTAIVSGEMRGILALAIILFAYLRKIRLEEQLLLDLFGSAFLEYKSRTGALIPKRRPK